MTTLTFLLPSNPVNMHSCGVRNNFSLIISVAMTTKATACKAWYNSTPYNDNNTRSG